MELLNGAEFRQNQVVVGQQTVTRGMGVSDDPMLMSLLSTSLYQTPLKSMLQEAVFNAWDAHKAAGTTDKPVEIIVTDDNQLIISDSGLGIAPENMYDIYCVYGASTKRKDNDQTGGFGLGCKAPFAYTESFRVTSAHGGKRSIYLLSRANDDNEGKPGITTLVQDLDCAESGLIVSIPLKSRSDVQRLYGYLKNDILPYSGIKWSLQYLDEEPEEGQEKILAPGEFVIEAGSMDNHGGLIAQYGGVAYPVPVAEEIQEQYNTLNNLVGYIGRIRAGFAPGTLTPLPSREGLNMSESTVKNLKAQMEVLIEELGHTVKPIFNLAIEWTAYCLGETGGEDVYIRMGKFGGAGSMEDVLSRDKLRRFLEEPAMEGIRPDLYEHIAKCCAYNTKLMVLSIGKDWFLQRRAIIWSKINGHNRVIFDYLKCTRKLTNGRYYISTHPKRQGPVARLQEVKAVQKFIKTGVRLFQHLGSKPHFRVFDSYHSNSNRMTNVVESNFPRYYKSGKKRHEKFKDRHKFNTERMKWDTLRYDNETVQAVALDYVYLARTIKDLDAQRSTLERSDDNGWSIPAIITGTSEKKYDQAVKFLESHGYFVHQIEKYVAPEPTSPEYAKAAAPEAWPRLAYYKDGYAHESDRIHKPSLFLVYSRTKQLKEQYHRNRLSHDSVRRLMHFFPHDSIAVVNHPNKVPTIEKTGAVNIKDRLKQMIDDVLADPDLANKLIMHHYAKEMGSIPSDLIAIPEFSKVLGLPYIRTKENIKFRQGMNLFEFLTENKSDSLCDDAVRRSLLGLTVPDETALSGCRKVLNALSILDKNELKSKVKNMTDGERIIYAQKLARFTRDITD